MKLLQLLFLLFSISSLQGQIATLNVSYPHNFKPSDLDATPTSTTNVHLEWLPIEGASKYLIKGRIQGTAPFASITSNNAFKNIGGLTPGQSYEWKVLAACTTPPSGSAITTYSDLNSFSMPLEKWSNNFSESAFITNVYPNPGKNKITVEITIGKSKTTPIKIIDILGREFFARKQLIKKGENRIEINTSHIPEGFYFVRIDKVIHPITIIK